MKKIQRIIGVVIIIMGTAVINGCTGKPKHEIQAAFDEFLYIYPTENMMDLFDKFDANFAISSHEKTELENRESVFEEIHLFFFVEEKKAYGYYSEIRYWYDEKDFIQEEIVSKIPVMYDEKGYHIKDGTEVTSEQREKIMNFKFKFQYLNLQPEVTKKYKIFDARYISNAAIYGMNYRVGITDENFNILVKENNDEDIIEKIKHLDISLDRMDYGVNVWFGYVGNNEKYFKYNESISHNLRVTTFRDEYLENNKGE